MSTHSLLAELDQAVQNGTPERRVDMLRRVTDLFLGQANSLNELQIDVFDDVLMYLVERIETQALEQLSTSLAPIDNAPIGLIQKLSRHDDIAVAGPVLAQSNRLTDNDLIDVARSKGQGHLLAISGRASLTEGVTDVLVERGDARVYHSLAKNSGAQFSESGYVALVKKSETDDGLAEELGLRLDIPVQLLRQLLARATDVIRARLVINAAPENREKIQHVLASIANRVGREAMAARDFAEVEDEIAGLNRLGKLNESVLERFVKTRDYEKMTVTLALFCGVKPALIERLLKAVQPEGLLVACKAARLSWPTVQLILETRFAHHAITETELRNAKDAFIDLSQASAQRTMRFMQVQETVKKAG